MKDISNLFEKASSMSEQYNARFISSIIEKVPEVWCRLEDDSELNWYLISKNNGKSVVSDYGYLSSEFPIALLMKECPDEIYKILSDNGILIEEYCDRYSCEEKILRRYVGDINLIDDRFLYDESMPFDEELFLIIDEDITYIKPYNFSFEDIK